MIALIDKKKHNIKWYVQGKFKYQHSPRITKNGTVLIFDNYYEGGRSRIVEIDIDSKEIVGYFSNKDFKFFSNTRGRIQLFDNKIFVRTFDVITKSQGIPKKGESDPTPMIALMWPIFYGLMFADVGHGLLLMGFGLIFGAKLTVCLVVLFVLYITFFQIMPEERAMQEKFNDWEDYCLKVRRWL